MKHKKEHHKEEHKERDTAHHKTETLKKGKKKKK